jgi:cell division protein FtsB
MESWQQILITVITVLGSGTAWNFYSQRMKLKAEQKKEESINSDTNLYRDDLRGRVIKLEELLAKGAEEKDEMRQRILILTEQVAQLRTENSYLKREIDILKSR